MECWLTCAACDMDGALEHAHHPPSSHVAHFTPLCDLRSALQPFELDWEKSPPEIVHSSFIHSFVKPMKNACFTQ